MRQRLGRQALSGDSPAGAMTDRQKFVAIRSAQRIWAVGAIHAEVDRLRRLHTRMWPRLDLCDRIVYLGNMIGRAPAARETLDALLNFRLHVLARPHSEADDVMYLRGGQEEMWQKLLQLQFASDPRAVLEWMISQGIGPTLESYDITVELPGVAEKDITVSVEEGVLSIKGEKRSEEKREEDDFSLQERSYGSFNRTFRIPDDVDADKISAKHENGVLSVTLPRTKPAKPKGRQISIGSK